MFYRNENFINGTINYDKSMENMNEYIKIPSIPEVAELANNLIGDHDKLILFFVGFEIELWKPSKYYVAAPS